MLMTMLCALLFLSPAYQANKEKQLEEVFRGVDQAVSSDAQFGEEDAAEIERIATESSISGIVMTPSGTSILSIGGSSDRLIEDLQFILFGGAEHTEIIKQTDAYTIQKSKDLRYDGDNLVLYGTLSNGNIMMLRITVASMEENTSFALKFLTIISILFTILGALVIYYATRRITNPILELSSISKRMADLEFDVKYNPKGDNEIDRLGMHMNELSSTLERAIGELKTANNELKLDLDRKEKMEKMRTEFLSNVSHELKTPLALIGGYAEGLKDSVNDDPESMAFYCDVILDETDKMSRMVRKLLTLNQLEFGEDEIEMSRFDLVQLIQSELASMSIMLEQNGITTEFAFKEAVYVWADPYKTEEVLMNYLSNAVNHIDGEKKIEVEIHDREDKIRVLVKNTGNRILEEDLERLWEKFYKADKSHSRQYGGSGIGLSIVKAIMDAMHQEYGAYNCEDGVIFWFELEKAK